MRTIRHWRSLTGEVLETRHLLAGDVDVAPELPAACIAPELTPAAAPTTLAATPVEPQYRVSYPPRVQLGNAPLPGTPAFDGKDQIEIIWQTVKAGEGVDDSFVVRIRSGSNEPWVTAETIEQIDTNFASRIMHSAMFRGLEWNRSYEYEVLHLRLGEIVDQYDARFNTRLAPGDPTAFTFAAYGDSAVPGADIVGFRAVQGQINESNAAFSVLLGDNIYDFGNHNDADARFDPVLNPEAARWTPSHIDYFAIGNHELFSGGKPSLDLFSMPQPVAGVNAFAEPPTGEPLEFYGSFDYGDVHFVTWNSNSAELLKDELLAQQMDFLTANLAASQATWKIVYMHHPFVGSMKLDLYSNTHYVEAIVPRLVEAGVDLVLVGDSHTYAWTYPITGLDDRDGNQKISKDEVVFKQGSPFEFTKGDGVVQLISGVGGRNLRNDPFGQPYMAQAHSAYATTLPVEFGFAEVRASPDALVVKYRSAATGQIVGDTNGNGRRDPDEVTFAEFRIQSPASPISPDVNRDGAVDSLDLDAICRLMVVERRYDAQYDLNLDQRVDLTDHELLRREYLDLKAGDANLDGRVNSADLVQVFQAGRFEASDELFTTWQEGDWNCDGKFGSSDLVRLFVSGYEEG
ncbi:MAG: metallophosphoesterase [Planctomycetales bacterium]|nr:metallophosphoesterase [Planctomycetales bacterium]